MTEVTNKLKIRIFYVLRLCTMATQKEMDVMRLSQQSGKREKQKAKIRTDIKNWRLRYRESSELINSSNWKALAWNWKQGTQTIALVSHASKILLRIMKGSEWRPKRKLQMNRRDSDKEGDKRSNHEFQNTDAQGTRPPTTTYMYVLCGLQEIVRVYLPW